MEETPKVRKAAGRPQVEVDLAELDGILDAGLEGPLTEGGHGKVKTALHVMAQALNKAKMRPSEKTDDVFEKPDSEAPEEVQPKAPRPGHGRNGVEAYRGASKVKIAHPDLTPGCPCAGCVKGKVYEMKDPAVAVRVVGQPNFPATVYERQRYRCNLCGEIFTAPAPEGIGDEKYDETVSAMLALQRYGSGMPFYRIEGLQASLGVPLPRSVQWGLVEVAAQQLAAVHNELILQAAQAGRVYNDDTTMRILRLIRPEGDTRTGVHCTGIIAETERYKIALFMTGRQHAGENLGDVLRHRAQGLGPVTQMCDALNRNSPKLSDNVQILLCSCLAHGRRPFVEVAESFPAECFFVLEQIGAVFGADREARELGLDPKQRLKFHQEMSGPIMEGLAKWMKEQLDEKLVEPNSGLGKAIRYLQNHWRKFTMFLQVAGAPLDNSIVERALKHAILHRKNSLFYLTMNGAMVGDRFMSLIHTCILNKVNPFDYLVELQRHAKELERDPAAWMPWNYRAQLDPSPE